jgi:hypothetical protein
LFVEWPIVGIQLSVVELSCALLLDARHAQRCWRSAVAAPRELFASGFHTERPELRGETDGTEANDPRPRAGTRGH